MKILLTGASGFIGKNLKEYLEPRFNLVTPDRSILNLTDQENTKKYLEENAFDVVIHCANTNNFIYHITDYDILNQNLHMFYNLESCHFLYRKMFYFGSGAEYDMRHYIPQMKESYFGTFIPQDPYGFAKYTMSKIAEQSSNIYDLRLFGVYGKYEEWTRRFISNAICRALKSMPITITQNVYFDYLWVDDLAEIIEWFLNHDPKYRHYNVCRGARIDLYTLACKVRKVLDIDCDILVGKEGFKPEYSGCNKRLLDEMGRFEFTDWDTSIYKLGEFYKENIEMIDEAKLI